MSLFSSHLKCHEIFEYKYFNIINIITTFKTLSFLNPYFIGNVKLLHCCKSSFFSLFLL